MFTPLIIIAAVFLLLEWKIRQIHRWEREQRTYYIFFRKE